MRTDDQERRGSSLSQQPFSTFGIFDFDVFKVEQRVDERL